jgi:arylsulfatase A-like enzyme
MSWPGTIPEGEATDALVSNIDCLPTLLRMAEIDLPDSVEGADITPTFSGFEVQDAVFAEYYHSLDPSRMMREKRFKYIHTEEDICELYDIENDPLESINLAWYSQYSDRVNHMDDGVLDGWEIPELPVWAPWNDLNERKQRLRLSGADIIDPRPEPPEWVGEYSGE